MIIKTILRARVCDKWIEFWFKEDFIEAEICSENDRFIQNECFHACIKYGDFLKIISEENLEEEIFTYGLKNRKMIWKLRDVGYNYLEFVSFLKDIRIVLIEKI